VRVARWSSLADTGDLPLMPHLAESIAIANRTHIRWSSWRSLLSGQNLPCTRITAKPPTCRPQDAPR
jgi:hypothetical protein